MTKNKHIPLMKVHMPNKHKLMPMLEETLYSGVVTEGNKVVEFEEKLKEKFNLALRPLSTNSCTSALQLAYRCVDSSPFGKYVITTPMTCTATNMPILAERKKIIWADIDPNTGNIDPKDVTKKIEKYGEHNIECISFVDFAGYPSNLDELIDISEECLIPLVEDAAQSLGAEWDNHYIGEHLDEHMSLSFYKHYVAYSFQAIKHLTTCDGGALIINTDKYDEEIDWEFAKKLKWYGINREAVKEATRWHYDIEHWGYKFHMNNLNATIGLAQLDCIKYVIMRHKENGKYFDKALKNIDGIQQMKIPKKSDPSYWIYMIRVKDRESFAKMMKSKGVDVNIAHVRNDQYTCFDDPELILNYKEELPGLEQFNNDYIAIPCGWWVEPEDREHIVECIKRGW